MGTIPAFFIDFLKNIFVQISLHEITLSVDNYGTSTTTSSTDFSLPLLAYHTISTSSTALNCRQPCMILDLLGEHFCQYTICDVQCNLLQKI